MAAQTEADALKKDFDELRHSVEQLSKDVSSLSKSLTDQLKAEASSVARQARKSAASVADEINTKGQESVEAVENAVKEHPFQGLLIAFGVGLVLSQFLSRR
ncbi:MAG: DUF883 family protein [Alphaproteobacteria bacterium]|jgi:ElaB/YqjD/DUF883 family membrane-anchored ribosome-binding protein|nr:DUF883 family protein [Alphaproteobacteria bacterium]